MQTTRCAFSLVEMLVVVAIIALLAALLFGMVGWGNQFAENSKNKAFMQKVHAGLCDYKIIYETFPPTTGSPLTSNRLAFYLCSEEDAVDRTQLNSSVLLGEVAKEHIVGEDLVDAHEGRNLLLYAYTLAGTADPRSQIDTPDVLMGDATDLSTTVYRDFSKSFDLWSRGPDGEASTIRNHESNADNESVSAPYGELTVY